MSPGELPRIVISKFQNVPCTSGVEVKHSKFLCRSFRRCIIILSMNFMLTGSGSSSGKALGYGLDGPGSIPDAREVEIFLHSFVSTLVLMSTQPPIK